MAQYTQEDVDKMRNSLKEKYNYDEMSDEHKRKFDDTFDKEIDEYRKQGIIEYKKDDETDATENDDDDSGDMDNSIGRKRGEIVESSEDMSEEDAVKRKENEQIDAQIAYNQERIDAERRKKEEDAEKKDSDYGGHCR